MKVNQILLGIFIGVLMTVAAICLFMYFTEPSYYP